MQYPQLIQSFHTRALHKMHKQQKRIKLIDRQPGISNPYCMNLTLIIF